MVPNGWLKTTFGKVTEIGNGQVDPKLEPYSSMVHIGPENVVSHTGQLTKLKSCSELGLISGKYEFDENSIVYSKIRPNLNKVCKPEFKGVCSADMYPIWAKNEVDIDYLQHYMLGPQFNRVAIAMSMRTGMPKINRSDLNSLSLILPPKPEQRKIAKTLSTWDKAISTTEKLIETSKQQKKALMQQLLTGKKRLVNPETGKAYEGDWEEVRLETHINLLSGHAFKSSAFEKSSHYKLLRGINITRGTLRWAEEQTFSWSNLDGFEKYLLNVGDIVISMDGSLVGRNYALITESNYEPMLLVQRVARIRCKTTLVHQYLLQHIASDRFKSYVDAVKTVTAIPHISAKDIKHFMVTLPSVEEQQKIASVLTAADKEIETLQAKLTHFKQEKKALMQQLLTGKRRVKVEEMEVA